MFNLSSIAFVSFVEMGCFSFVNILLIKCYDMISYQKIIIIFINSAIVYIYEYLILFKI